MTPNDAERMSRALQDLRPEAAVPAREVGRHSLAERMQRCAVPGASIAVFDDTKVVWEAGFGLRAVGTQAPVLPSTPFQAGSISKPVFALAVMRLVEDGRLDLDKDVNEQLSAWKVPPNGGWQPRLTLRQLLSHTAGTNVHGFLGYPVGAPLPSVPQILDGAGPANTDPVIVDALPGLQFRYSGGGTTIAQQVVADVTRMPFPQAMHELVLGPTGMTDSTYEQPPPAALAARAALGHADVDVAIPGGWRIHPEMAAAGLWTTAVDLARLMVEVARGLRGEPSRLGLRRDTLARMLEPQLSGQNTANGYVGIGWFCQGKDDHFRFGHQGINEGFVAEVRCFPARGTGAAVMLNATVSRGATSLPSEILGAIAREYHWPEPPRKAPPIPGPPLEAGYAGDYRNGDGVTVRVTRDGDALLLQFATQPPLTLEPTTGSEFRARAVNMRALFEAGDDGTARSVTLVQNGQAIRLPRVEG